MFKSSIKSIGIIFRYAPALAALKILTALITAGGTVVSVLFLQWTADSLSYLAADSFNMSEFSLYGLGLIGTAAIPVLFGGYLDNMLQIMLERKLSECLAVDIIGKFMRIPYTDYENPALYDTLQRMSKKSDEMILRLFKAAVAALRYMFTLAGMIIIFMQVGAGICISFALLFIPLIWLNFKTADMMNHIYNEQSMEQRKMEYLEKLMSERSSLYELKIFNAVDYLVTKWKLITDLLLKQRIQIKVRAHNYYLLGNILTFLWLLINLLFLCRSVLVHKMTVGVFISVFVAVGEALDCSESLYMSLQQLRWRAGIVSHFQKFMGLEENVRAQESEPVGGKELPAIVFENVSFSYPNSDRLILDDVSFSIGDGEHVALVGENGAGKTTIVKLLCGLYQPSKGRILVGGRDIQELSDEQRSSFFSVVFQDYCRFCLTLRENIALGRLEEMNEDEKIREALQKAGISWGDDLDIVLGKIYDNGKEPSGGQWQRIAIARAYFSDCRFVILDEPTAALDPVAESEVYRNISSVLQNKNCIFISHRLASAKLADRILVLSDGKLAEDGTHQQLMEQKGIYAGLYHAQSRWYCSGEGETGE